MRPQSRKTYRPTSRTSQQVETLVAAGVRKEVIARTIGCTVSELEKHHAEELELGLDMANAKVIQNVFNTATSNSRQAMTAAALWLKNKAGWKDKQSHEVTGEDGRPIEHASVELDPKTVEAIRRRYILSEMTPTELAVLKVCAEASHLDFTRLFFREREGSEFRVGPHHKIMCDVADQIISGRYKRVIVNVPPGYTKTELFVINFIARGLALNPRARFIHSSYSDKLVLDNSVKVRDVINLPLYQAMWPLSFRIDTRAKGLWRTRQGGGLLASPAGGAITGFRAGTMDAGFTGAIIIDDPLKPDDARSDILREFINARYNNTFRSRLAHEDVPIIIVMQRIHANDFTGNLLEEGDSGESWHHLWLPIEIDNSQGYPQRFTYGIPIEHNLPDGPLWKAKHNAKQIESLKLLGEVYDAQYAQLPTKEGGNLFQLDWFGRYKDLPALEWRIITADTAQKTKERNDYSVFECWGKTKSGRAILLDVLRGRFEAPELEKVAREFWRKHSRMYREGYAPLRKFKVEDKVSGTGLIQALRKGPYSIPVVAVPRDRDKYMRALDILPHCAAGNVMLPIDDGISYPWLKDFEEELRQFRADDTGFDDQVDAFMDGVQDILGSGRDIIESTVRGHI